MGARIWKIGDKSVDLSKSGMIMGVLNVTPDSFSDGGEFFATDAAIAGGIKMALEGANIIDVGGESTRPGAEPVSVKEELQRVVPVIEKLRAKINISISIDTSKPEVASTALDAGASIINDVSAGRGDEKMLSLAARRKAAIVLMHMRGEPRTMQKNPHYEDVVTEVADFFRQQYGRALECGVDPMMQELLQLWFRSWRSIIEIILLSVGIYYGYLYFRGTRGAKVLTGLAIVFLTLTLISTLLNLVVIGWLVRSFSVFLAIALVVIFQPELRRGLAELGGHPIFSLTSEKRETVHDLAEAVTQLANKQFGALLAIERDTSIRVYEETGVTLDSDFSVELVLSIFHPKAALHDGGVIIRNGRIARSE